MIHNKKIKNIKAFTLIEMIIAVLIMAFIGAYAWKIYSNSGETMRHTVSQSQIQADVRNFLDNLELEMMSCYSFDNIDTENKKFSFYTYTYGKKTLEDTYYDVSGNPLDTSSESDQSIKVLKIEYSYSENGTVTKKRTPGFLLFLRRPMEFQDASTSSAFTDKEKAMTKEVLRNINDFEVKGYSQKPNTEKNSNNPFIYTPVTPETASQTAFIVLRLHALKDETGNRRDEEIDIVTKFYSAIKLADINNPGAFCSTDSDGRF